VILLDTSAWIEFERATGSQVDQRLAQLIDQGSDVAVTEPMVAEVISGARSDRKEAELLAIFAGFVLLPFASVDDFNSAARIYRACRKAGITPRGLLDCMIAAVAIRHEVPVLAHDVDMARIGQVMPLELDEASLQPGHS
jgi:predicted nucleic acid-binding protein